MMDILATVPYYTAYLSSALLLRNIDVMVGSISYYLDPGCFRSRGVTLEPGLMDVVSQFRLSPHMRRALKLAEALLNMLALSMRFSFRPPAIVHVQYLPMLRWKIPAERWFLKFCRYRGAPIVLTVHDLMPHDSASKYKALFHSLYENVDLLICHSESVRMRLRDEFGVLDDKIAVVPHGPLFYEIASGKDVERSQRLGIQKNQVCVLWQGIIFPYKGVDVLLRAWRRVEERTQDACLVIAGTGSQEILDQIKEVVEQQQLKRVILHLRFISSDELVALYSRADIVVYPYREITTSGALATGLALGKAIVATNLPVFRELLTSGVNAILTDVNDADQLAEALQRLIGQKTLREDLSREVRKMNFGEQSWAEIAAKTIEAYDRAKTLARSPRHV